MIDRPLVQTTQITVEGLGLDEATWFHSIKNSDKEEARGISLSSEQSNGIPKKPDYYRLESISLRLNNGFYLVQCLT
jgi:hypothetical protein